MQNKTFEQFEAETIQGEALQIAENFCYNDDLSYHMDGEKPCENGEALLRKGYTMEDIYDNGDFDLDIDIAFPVFHYGYENDCFVIAPIGEFFISLDFVPKEFRKQACDSWCYNKTDKGFYITCNSVAVPIAEKTI